MAAFGTLNIITGKEKFHRHHIYYNDMDANFQQFLPAMLKVMSDGTKHTAFFRPEEKIKYAEIKNLLKAENLRKNSVGNVGFYGFAQQGFMM